jgi:hypothetical protein
MATNYPGALDTTTELPNDHTDSTLTDRAGVDHAGEHVNLSDAVRAIEGELGINPSASFADVAARLNAMTTVRKTADQTPTNQALTNITDMAFAIPAAAGAMYTFEFTIMWTTTTATSGLGVALTFPTLGTGGYCTANVNIAALAADGAAANFHGVITGASGADTVLSTAAVATGTVYTALVNGVLYAGTTANTAGTLQLQCRAEATNNAAVIKAGSHGILWTG